MTTRLSQSLVALTLLALLVGCRGDSSWLPTQPDSRSSNAGVWLQARGYPNSWEAMGVVGTTLSDHTLSVFAHDGKSPVSGVQIVWAVTGSGGWVSSTHDTTRDGVSAPPLTLGPGEGRYTVTATAPTLPRAPQITFKATAVTVMVRVRGPVDGGFLPASVTVPRGRSVGWRYDDGGEGDVHNVTFEDGAASSGDLWNLWAGRLYHSKLFEGPPRAVRYRCTYHSTSFTEGEVGTVTVE
ncbi:MAG: hypothetical protein ABR499_05140 [Gemmatimonadaceae bacterium]